MKKIVVALLCVLAFYACSSCDPKPDPNPGSDSVPVAEKIVGEWVYDHPEEGVWETMKFTSSGIFYYSNKDVSWKINNNKNDGRYTVNGSNITGTYMLDGTAQELSMEIKKITDYSFTALFNSVGLTFTYARLLDVKQMKPGESYTPNYSVLVRSNIIGYSSHKPEIVEVNASTGVITAMKSGHTYIDVVTEDGTAVIEVVSYDEEKMFDDFDYVSMLKKSVPEVVDELGNNYLYKDNNNGVVYLSDSYVVDTVKYFTGVTDYTHIEMVQLLLNSNVTNNKVLNYLKNRYELFYNKNGLYAFSTDRMVDSRMVMVMFDETNRWVTFGLMDSPELWDDFSSLFGAKDATVYNQLTSLGYTYSFTDYGYSQDGSDYYTINGNAYINLVGFVFNPKKVMCEYWVYLNEKVDYQKIFDNLNSAYVLNRKESSSSAYVFYDSNNRIKVTFMTEGAISYTDTTQEPFVAPTATPQPSQAAWPDLVKGLGMTHDQILAEYGNNPYENTDESIMYFINNEYIGLYVFIFNSTTNLVRAVSAVVNESVESSKIVEILNSQYTVYANGTANDGSQYAWINSSDLSTATVGVVYLPESRIIQYQDLTSSGSARKFIKGSNATIKELHPNKVFRLFKR